MYVSIKIQCCCYAYGRVCISGGDSIDMSIASLALMAAVAGKDLWAYVQSMPHLFSVGGLFYKQVDRDLGLVDGKHCTLPTLPGKVGLRLCAYNNICVCSKIKWI